MKARIKGTNILVECKGIGVGLGDNIKGISCKYINGPHRGATEVIPGECLVECDVKRDYTQLRNQAAIAAMQSLLSNEIYFKRLCDFFDCGDAPSPKLIEQVNFQAIKVADDLINELKNKDIESEEI